MATATTHGAIDPHPVLGAFLPEDVLLEYDAPLVFTFRDALGREAVAFLAEAGPGKSAYLAAHLSRELRGELVGGRLPVREAFAGRVWVVTVGAAGQIESVTDEPTAPARYLPSESLTLSAG